MFPISLSCVVLDCPDIASLANFYVKLLGWEKKYEDENWIDIQSTSGGVKLGFQENEFYTPPIWPEEPTGQQQMLHLDFKVSGKDEMEAAISHAIECGARKAEVQFSDHWTVMIDPVGHPFCFVTD